MTEDRNHSVERELSRFKWTAHIGTMQAVCSEFIGKHLNANKVVSAKLQFQNGQRRGVIECKFFPHGRCAYYRTGTVFEINTMMIAPAGGDIVQRTSFALMRDNGLNLGCIRIESILSDDLLARFVRRGWIVRYDGDNSPLLTRDRFDSLRGHASRISRAYKSHRSRTVRSAHSRTAETSLPRSSQIGLSRASSSL